jgi:hypothetical protein
MEERTERGFVFDAYVKGKTIVDKSYNQFNGRTLYEFIDDGTKRWNGYIPAASPLLDADQSRIFINFTRNQIISFLAKAAMQRVESKIKAVNKKTGVMDQKFSDCLKDLNRFSSDAENGDARYLEVALEAATKGTAIVYEGYRRETQEIDVPVSFDAEKGKIKTKKEKKVIFDDCYQRIVPLEDFYIANPYEPNLQKQPWVIERCITTYLEGEREFSKYDNWKYVKAGSYTMMGDPTTFYRNKVYTDLNQDQIEICRYYNRRRNHYSVMINGVILYKGAIPFKDGKYPYAKYIFEPFENAFFWGSHFPNKVMGLQDEMNTQINMFNDKQAASLLPFGLSSDLDDLIEDDVLQPNKIRKVGDINKWRFESLPGVTNAEMQMFQLIMNLANDDSGDMSGAGDAATPNGGKVPVRQVLLKQQESINKLSFSMNFLEDGERDRTELRVSHIMQFYSIPKIEKITGVDGQSLEKMTYRDIRLDGADLPDGQKGTKVIRLIDDTQAKDPLAVANLQDELSVQEEMGTASGTPTYAVAMSVNSFYDYNFEVQIVKNSSFEKNEVLDQAVRHEYANWRLGLIQLGVPVDAQELVDWVDEAYDIDSERFRQQAPAPQQAMPGAPQQGQGAPQPQQGQGMNPAAAMSPAKVPAMGEMV